MRRKQTKARPSTSSAAHFLYSDVQLLIDEIQRRRLILLEDNPGHVEIWSPGVPVPKPLQKGVFKHGSMLVEMIACNDVRVCPSARLHKRYHNTRRGICTACERLASALPFDTEWAS